MTGDRWVILELSPLAEGQDPDVICRSIQNVVRGADVFIPAYVTQRGDDRVFQYVFDGYAFLRLDRPEASLLRLENTRYVQSLLIDPVRKGSLATVSDDDIIRMRRSVQSAADQGIDIGDIVLIVSGPYKEVTGTVIEVIPETDSVQVHVRLLSKEAILMLPRSFLHLQEKRVRPALLDLLPTFRNWIVGAKALAAWDGKPDRLLAAFDKYRQLHQLNERACDLICAHDAMCHLPLNVASIGRAAIRWARAYTYDELFARLTFQVHLAGHGISIPATLAIGAVRWYRLKLWQSLLSEMRRAEVAMQTISASRVLDAHTTYELLHDFLEAHTVLTEDLRRIGLDISYLENRMLDNVLIDGFNLVFRCRFAPKLRNLRDKRGRPTGIIYGFLRSMASLQKYFPRSVMHVCWDGTSRRRKAAYGGYKANRPDRNPDDFDQVGFLREILPLIGATQHWNPDEEADDVIASLVHGPMANQRNVIVSTDRDLLQLVGRTTIVLTPAVGSGKEKLYDEDQVMDEYGVEPSRMPHLRALTGDTSDNLPGVSRVPMKVLAALVRSYGTVDQIYSSGLPGLTKCQYSRLREAEAQVRINTDLMTLRMVPVIRTDPNPDRKMAEARLADVNVSPDTIRVFFGESAGFVKEAYKIAK